MSLKTSLPLLFSLLAVSPDVSASIIAGNLVVIQNNDGNTAASVSGSFGFSAGQISYAGGTRGDFALRFDGATPAADRANGIMMVSISENGRSNQGSTIGAGLGYATPAIQYDANIGGSWGGWGSSINVGATSITGTSSGSEWNANQAIGYFKYSEFLGGLVTNGTHLGTGGVNNGAMTSFASSSVGFTVANGLTDPGTATLFDNTTSGNDGIYTLRLGSFTAPGTSTLATSQNGILLVTGGKNEDNYSLSRANADGTFTIITKDNGADSTTFENDPVGFVYVPVGKEGVVAMGRVDAEAEVTASSGTFTVAKGGVGQWYLSAAGHDPSNSTLLISPEGLTTSSGTFSQDNIWSYQWDSANTRWVIEGRDIPGSGTSNPSLQNLAANEMGFSFLLIPEPSSALLGIGGILIALRRRRAAH